METKRLGNSDMSITRVGFGAWALGGDDWQWGWGPQDDQRSVEAIHRALELGVNWIDTAAAYGVGHSEEVVARALESWSGSRPYVFTKCGLRWDEKGNTYGSLDPASIRQECEDSLRRLRADVIDLYQIHWPINDPDVDARAWETMAQLKREGKVRWIGLSNWSVEQMRMAQAIAPITSLQPPYSLVRPKIEQEILPHCLKEGIGVIAYSPMASGLLTGAMTRERIENLPDSDWRKEGRAFREPDLSKNLAAVEKLREIGRSHGRSPGEVAIAWTLRHPAVSGAIVGARSAKQVEGVFRAAEIVLSEEEIAHLDNNE